jgi:hypothetical protein
MAGKLNARKLATLKAGTKTADGGGLYAISNAEGAWHGASCSQLIAAGGS